MSVHVHTVSRIISEMDGKYQSNGSRETVRAFQKGFSISEEEYQRGPDQYSKPSVDMPLNPERITLVYQLSHLTENLNDVPTPLFISTFQHLDNWRDYFVVIVDLYDRGMDHGVQAVINKNKVPKDGDKVLVWARKRNESEPGAYFAEWNAELLKEGESLFGVCVRTIGP
ncbi:MAG: hypothetical protein GC154_02630 [bacterium]|nr:hypothetical protein [bacterium]